MSEDIIAATMTPEEEEKEQKRKYHRDYMRKRYQENHSKLRESKKLYYLKRNNKINEADAEKYGLLLPAVIKLKQALKEIAESNPAIIHELVAQYTS
jgi:hypothetical protein